MNFQNEILELQSMDAQTDEKTIAGRVSTPIVLTAISLTTLLGSCSGNNNEERP